MKKRMKNLVKLNNSGSSLAVVLILVTFMAVLSVTATTMAMTNLRIKKLTNTSTKSFYSAEDAVDQIYTALGKISLESLNEAYSEQLAGMPEYASPEDNYIYNQSMRMAYAKKVLDRCKVSGVTLAENDGSGQKIYMDYSNASTDSGSAGYNQQYKDLIDVINSFILLDADNAPMEGKSESEKLLKVDSIGSVKVVNTKNTYNSHDLNNYRLELQQCVVKYKSDSSGFYSSISFDTSMSMPDMFIDFVALTKGIDAFKNYSLVGNTGIEIAGDSANSVMISSSAYAGKNGGILIGAGATLNLNMNGNNRTAFITEGNITVGTQAGAGTLTVSGNNIASDDSNGVELWCNGIDVSGNNSDVNINAKSYVKDDLQVDSNNSKVVLNGIYNGYGWQSSEYSGNHANSSAIIINGKNNTINISGLTKMLVAGRTYIDYSHYMLSDGFKNLVDENVSAEPYKTGESISSSGMQEMYLVPSMFITGKSNPVINSSGVKVDTQSLKKKLQPATVKDSSGQSDENTDTAFFGAEYLDYDTPYVVKTVEGKTYYYLNFSSDDNMKAYIEAVYNDAVYNATTSGKEDTILNRLKNKLSSVEAAKLKDIISDYDASRKYVQQLVEMNSDTVKNEIIMGNNSDNVVVDGEFINISNNEDNVVTVVSGREVTASQDKETYFKTQFNEYATKFNMLYKTLQDDPSVYAETYISDDNSMYKSIIDDDGFIAATTGIYNSNGLSCSINIDGKNSEVRVFNNGNSPYVVGDKMGSFNGILVVSGDVIVDHDFNGTIIAGGKITLTNNAKITNTSSKGTVFSEEMLNEIKAIVETESGTDVTVKDRLTAFMNVFRAYNAKDISGSNGSELSNLEFKDFITLSNWTKTEIGE